MHPISHAPSRHPKPGAQSLGPLQPHTLDALQTCPKNAFAQSAAAPHSLQRLSTQAGVAPPHVPPVAQPTQPDVMGSHTPSSQSAFVAQPQCPPMHEIPTVSTSPSV